MKISINTKLGEAESNIQIEVSESVPNLADIVSDAIRIIEVVQTPKKIILENNQEANCSGGGRAHYPGSGGIPYYNA